MHRAASVWIGAVWDLTSKEPRQRNVYLVSRQAGWFSWYTSNIAMSLAKRRVKSKGAMLWKGEGSGRLLLMHRAIKAGTLAYSQPQGGNGQS